MTWRDAFLKQAHSDYSVYKKLNELRFPLCHKLHYLQMATEKLAKAYQCNNQNIPPKKTHLVLVRMLRILKGRPAIRKQMGFNKANAWFAYIDSLLDIALRIEKLAPVGGNFDQLNPEYPWKNSKQQIYSPVEYNYNEFAKTELVKFERLVCSLFRVMGLPLSE